MNVFDLAIRKVELRKVSQTNGGEWHGPCPGCGGDDRFHVWPGQNEGKGAYWCRQCEKSGDAIQFLRDFEGMGYRQACEYLGETVRDVPETHGPTTQRKAERPQWQPADRMIEPGDIWQERAERFVSWTQKCLETSSDVLSWLAVRGITPETAVNYRLGWNPGEKDRDIYRPRTSWGLPVEKRNDGRPKMLWIPMGLVIPYVVDGVIYRLRIRRPEGEPRYYVIPGSSMATMLLEPTRRAFVIVESELDGIAVVASSDLAGAVAIGSVSAKPDAEAAAVLRGSLQILNALDYDRAGAKAMSWWTDQFPQCDRWPVPQGKDPGDAIRMGTNLKSWIKAGLPPALTIVEGGGEKAMPAKKDPDPDVGPDLPEAVRELRKLLLNNPRVQIINDATRYTVLRDGKFTGGRINHLVFRERESRDYLLSHPAEIIDWKNLIYQKTKEPEVNEWE